MSENKNQIPHKLKISLEIDDKTLTSNLLDLLAALSIKTMITLDPLQDLMKLFEQYDSNNRNKNKETVITSLSMNIIYDTISLCQKIAFEQEEIEIPRLEECSNKLDKYLFLRDSYINELKSKEKCDG
jgi:hypothetical protein